MSAGKHTPGPWTPFILDKPLAHVPAYVAQCIKTGPGAEFFFVGADAHDGPVDVCHVGNGPRRAANARLIAAAPDQHEANKVSLMILCALRKAKDWHPNVLKDIDFAIEANRAAIAKATGSAS